MKKTDESFTLESIDRFFKFYFIIYIYIYFFFASIHHIQSIYRKPYPGIELGAVPLAICSCSDLSN